MFLKVRNPESIQKLSNIVVNMHFLFKKIGPFYLLWLKTTCPFVNCCNKKFLHKNLQVLNYCKTILFIKLFFFLHCKRFKNYILYFVYILCTLFIFLLTTLFFFTLSTLQWTDRLKRFRSFIFYNFYTSSILSTFILYYTLNRK